MVRILIIVSYLVLSACTTSREKACSATIDACIPPDESELTETQSGADMAYQLPTLPLDRTNHIG